MLIPNAFRDEISSFLSPEQILDTASSRISYASDATDQCHLPDLIVLCRNEEQIVQLMQCATRYRVPVTPRGAGVGFSGGCLALHGGVVLSTAKMNRILDIDEDNLTITVEPGVITQHIQDAVHDLGLFYPPDPASLHTSTIGGNVAECAGGLSAVKYGVTKHYVLGARFVLPDGSACSYGGKLMKNVVGYDLLGLLVGSEGTLAIFTELTLKLLPIPEYRRTILCFFPSVLQAGETVSAVIRAKIIPTALELLDSQCLRVIGDHHPLDIPEGCRAALILELDGKPHDVESDANKIHALVGRFEGTLAASTQEKSERERIWDIRRAVSPAIARLGNLKINEDIVVPRSCIANILNDIQAISKKCQLPVICFGHAGDGNIHVNLMVDRSDQSQLQRADLIVNEVFERTIAYGGAISGEHGIGISKKRFIQRNLSPEVLNLSVRLKMAFDPLGILNPGKIFPDSVVGAIGGCGFGSNE